MPYSLHSVLNDPARDGLIPVRYLCGHTGRIQSPGVADPAGEILQLAEQSPVGVACVEFRCPECEQHPVLEVDTREQFIKLDGVKISLELLRQMTQPNPKAWVRYERIEIAGEPMILAHTRMEP